MDIVPIEDTEHIEDRQTWPCPGCGDSRDFRQPPCVDGHTDDGGPCPEWACVDCGHAVLVATPPPVPTARVHLAA